MSLELKAGLAEQLACAYRALSTLEHQQIPVGSVRVTLTAMSSCSAKTMLESAIASQIERDFSNMVAMVRETAVCRIAELRKQLLEAEFDEAA